MSRRHVLEKWHGIGEGEETARALLFAGPQTSKDELAVKLIGEDLSGMRVKDWLSANLSELEKRWENEMKYKSTWTPHELVAIYKAKERIKEAVTWDDETVAEITEPYVEDNENFLPERHHSMDSRYRKLRGKNIKFDSMITLSSPCVYQYADLAKGHIKAPIRGNKIAAEWNPVDWSLNVEGQGRYKRSRVTLSGDVRVRLGPLSISYGRHEDMERFSDSHTSHRIQRAVLAYIEQAGSTFPRVSSWFLPTADDSSNPVCVLRNRRLLQQKRAPTCIGDREEVATPHQSERQRIPP